VSCIRRCLRTCWHLSRSHTPAWCLPVVPLVVPPAVVGAHACDAHVRAGHHHIDSLRVYWESPCIQLLFNSCTTPKEHQKTELYSAFFFFFSFFFSCSTPCCATRNRGIPPLVRRTRRRSVKKGWTVRLTSPDRLGVVGPVLPQRVLVNHCAAQADLHTQSERHSEQ